MSTFGGSFICDLWFVVQDSNSCSGRIGAADGDRERIRPGSVVVRRTLARRLLQQVQGTSSQHTSSSRSFQNTDKHVRKSHQFQVEHSTQLHVELHTGLNYSHDISVLVLKHKKITHCILNSCFRKCVCRTSDGRTFIKCCMFVNLPHLHVHRTCSWCTTRRTSSDAARCWRAGAGRCVSSASRGCTRRPASAPCSTNCRSCCRSSSCTKRYCRPVFVVWNACQ